MMVLPKPILMRKSVSIRQHMGVRAQPLSDRSFEDVWKDIRKQRIWLHIHMKLWKPQHLCFLERFQRKARKALQM